MAEPDSELLRRAIAGDAAALSALLQQHWAYVTGALRVDAQWSPHFDVDDVMQVTCLEAFLRIGRFDPAGPATFQSWLLHNARNNLRDLIRERRRAKRRPARSARQNASDSCAALVEQMAASSTWPSRDAARKEAVKLIERAMERLPASYADVIRLYDLEGLPVNVVAQRMGRSPNAVYMLRARAHDRLRELLGPESDFFTKTA